MDKLWTFFTKIIIITIPNSKRINALKENLYKVGITKYEIREFKPAQKISNDGGKNIKTFSQISKHDVCDETCQNIANNHLTLLKKAAANDYDNILILEDDALFDPITPSKLYNIISWLTRNKWDIFYFGYCPWPVLASVPVNKHIVKVFSPYCAHCYSVSRRGLRKIINSVNNQVKISHIDKFYAKQDLLKYAAFPALSFQSDDPALFKKAISNIGVNMSFRSISKTLEVFSLIIPLLIIFIIIYIGYKIHLYVV
ncbi:hypothetical protein OAK19_02425 [Aureispira]|nr:hypothetical protein [Aureispira sp.]